MRGWRLALVLCLCAAAARAQEPASNAEYRLGPRDLVEIKVLEIPELNVERRVSERGTVALPLLGDFPVEGLTASEFRAKLEALLKEKYVNRADVSIVVKDFANKPVTIVGAVQHPGPLTISGRWSLLQAISAAGGLTEGAGRKIYVLRRAENGLTDTLEVSTDDLFRSAAQMWNVPIYPSDVVNVPARSTLRIFCIGEVKAPGAVEFYERRPDHAALGAREGGRADRPRLEDDPDQAAGRLGARRRDRGRLQAGALGKGPRSDASGRRRHRDQGILLLGRSVSATISGAVIEIHFHCLPRVDDGPASWDEALALCRAALAEGSTRIVATPHVLRGTWANTNPAVRDQLVQTLNERLGGKPRILPGCEYFYSDEVLALARKGPMGPLTGLARGSYLLIELGPGLLPPSIGHAFHELRVLGAQPDHRAP